MINAMTGVITRPAALAATTPVVVTASVDRTGDHDDFSHTVMFDASPPPSAGPDRLAAVPAGGDPAGLDGNDTFFSGPGNDSFFGDTAAIPRAATGTMDRDKAVFANALSDYAISAELHEFMSTPAMTNVPRITVTGEGTDTLVGIESVEFLNGTATETSDDVELMIVEAGTDEDEILPGDEKENSALHGMDDDDFIFGFAGDDTIDGGGCDDMITGGEGDDMITGGGGDDMITGGEGDDILDGGRGADTVVYAGSRADYLIRTTGDRFVDEVFHIQDKDSMTNGDLCRDTADNVEMIGFGTSAPAALNTAFASDAAPVATTLATGVHAPPATIAFDADGMITDVVNWFTNAGTEPTFVYSLNPSATTMLGFRIDAGTGAITMPSALIATAAITVTASVDETGDYDDISHVFNIAVPLAPSRVQEFSNGEDEALLSGDQATAPADGDEHVRPHEPDDFEAVAPMTGDGDCFGV